MTSLALAPDDGAARMSWRSNAGIACWTELEITPTKRLAAILLRHARTFGFTEACRPSRAARPPSGLLWVHEIKHDSFQLMDGLPGAIPLGYIARVENLLATRRVTS
jgi:hypothetical protein